MDKTITFAGKVTEKEKKNCVTHAMTVAKDAALQEAMRQEIAKEAGPLEQRTKALRDLQDYAAQLIALIDVANASSVHLLIADGAQATFFLQIQFGEHASLKICDNGTVVYNDASQNTFKLCTPVDVAAQKINAALAAYDCWLSA
jgi:hypothetical protein